MSKRIGRDRSRMGIIPKTFVYTDKTTRTETRKNTLTHLRIDASVKVIPSTAFQQRTSLVQVQLPKTLKRIGRSAFRDCPSLKCVQVVPGLASKYFYEDGFVLFPATGLQIDECAFSSCNSVRNIVFSSTAAVRTFRSPAPPTTTVGVGAFQACKGLISVQLPDGLLVIEDSLFCGCESLTTVEIPSSVIKIRGRAFNNCRSLASFDLPHGLVEIGIESFQGCQSIETLHIPSTVVAIGQLVFSGCERLKYIKLPSTLEIIEAGMLNGCHGLEGVEIPATVKQIGDNAFSGCKSLSHIRIPRSVGGIGRSAFSGCENLISIELPDQAFYPSRSFDIVLLGCKSVVNLVANPTLMLHSSDLRTDSNIGRVVDGYDDFLLRLNHRFDQSPLNKLCYYQSYYSPEEVMVKLGSLMDGDPLTATTQVDEFGMTPLHLLSLSQTPNLRMLLAVVHAGPLDHMIRGRDSFGSTPMDYLCLNKMPSSTQVIRSLMQATFVKRVNWLGLDRWKLEMMQVFNGAMAMDRSSRSREIGLAFFHLTKYERKEILSLVELYLWSVKIDEVSSKQDGADRQICRINSGASIVMPHVLQFLGDPDLEDYVGPGQ